MKRSTYSERDYAFGQRMFTLRTSIKLTQAAVAKRLGVSRQTVVEWEAGSSYPKADHLKPFIELGIQGQAFAAGHEDEEILELWQASHQKVLIDEAWLQGLTGQKPQHLPHSADASVEQIADQSGPRVDWGNALAVPSFYGREQELAQISRWIVEERCRVVSVLGLGGIGKSALTVTLMHQVAAHFQVVIWRSLRDTPSCEAFLDTCLDVFAPHRLQEGSVSLEERLTLLMQYLREQRTLLVLDNLEQLLEEGVSTGRMRPGYEGYGWLLKRVAQMEHQSCLLLTSREKVGALVSFEGHQTPVRALSLVGLDTSACEQILTEQNVTGTSAERARLISVFTGNPLALKIVAQSIMELFGGEITSFLAQETMVFGSMRELLGEQFARLSAMEQTVLLWLAIVREPVSIETLFHLLGLPLPRTQVIEAVEGLRRRSLIERGVRAGSFTLQSVVLEYATAQLIAEVASEIEQCQPHRLIEHGLELATAKEYVRQIQGRLIVTPLLESLRSVYPLRGAVEARLLALLDQQRERANDAQGYGPANLLALLRMLRGHLRGLDLSHLSLRGAYLQGVEMQDTTLAEAHLRETLLTEAFAAPWVVALSPNGSYRAAGNRRGEVLVWREEGTLLDQAWQAHTSVVQALAFSPDGRTLATGSCDTTIKMWNLENAALLWVGRHTGSIRSLTFAPDGHTLVSGGDATIAIWNASTGIQLQTLSEQRSPVYALTWSRDGRFLASGSADGSIRLWDMQEAQPNSHLRLLAGHTDLVWSVAFAPDGHTLASGSFDGTVKLWDIARGEVDQTLTGHVGPVNAVAWNADGSLLASCGHDATIQVWDGERKWYRTILHGHSAAVQTISFLPDGHRLLSGSEDGTLRVWDVESGQCLSLVQGYAVTLSDLAWSPDGNQLASSGSDTLVTIWDQVGKTLPRLLQGHQGGVNGVAWSPDGRFLASGGVDHTIRVWDVITATGVQVMQDESSFWCVAWSPDGRLLAGGSSQGEVQVWDMTTGSHLWVGHGPPTMVRHVAWSPDGTRLASCGNDGSVILWNGFDGTLLTELPGHPAMAMSVVWSPDGERLASCGGGRGSGEVFVWDIRSGEHLRAWTERSAVVSTLVWSPHGAVLVSGDVDGMLRWWDIESGACVRTQKAHQGVVQSLRISPDGESLASCGDDNVIHIWDLESGNLLRTQRHDRPYERLNISGIQGLTQAQKASLYALGAIEQPTVSGIRHMLSSWL